MAENIGRRWLVAIDGAGEFEKDFTVLVLEGRSPQAVVERITAPEWGYGRNQDGIAYVAPFESVKTFRINDATRKSVSEAEFVVDMPEYRDPDGITSK